MLTAVQLRVLSVIVDAYPTASPELKEAVAQELRDATAREPKPTPEETNQGEEQHV